MKLYVLSENMSIDSFKTEFGLSYLIEYENKKILFDTGHSEIFIKNAELLHIDLDKIKTILKEEKERKITKKINKANVLLKTGVDLFKQQLYSEAILYFQSSYRLYPTEETKLYIRRSKIRLEKTAGCDCAGDNQQAKDPLCR